MNASATSTTTDHTYDTFGLKSGAFRINTNFKILKLPNFKILKLPNFKILKLGNFKILKLGNFKILKLVFIRNAPLFKPNVSYV